MFDEKKTDEGIDTGDSIENDGIFSFTLPKQQLKEILLESEDDFITRFEVQVHVEDQKGQKDSSEEKISIDILFDGQYQFNAVIKEPINEQVITDSETGVSFEWDVPNVGIHSTSGCTLSDKSISLGFWG